MDGLVWVDDDGDDDEKSVMGNDVGGERERERRRWMANAADSVEQHWWQLFFLW